MKTLTRVLLLLAAGIVTPCLAQPDATKPAPDAAAPAVGATRSDSLSPEDRAQYADVIRRELESSTQLTLLNELADEHLKRSTQAQQNRALEKTRWEADLAQEFRTRSAQILGQLNEFTKQRLALEARHGDRPASTAALGSLEEAKLLTPDERAYVTKLDERLLKVRQELALVDEASRTLYSELQTNTTTEAVARVSDLLDVNARQARQWEREQADVELRKLEFRALRR